MKISTFNRLFYISRFFFDFILIYAVDKLFFLHKGLNLYQIAILLAFWSGFAILLEIPSGALADKWSRKNMLVLSGLFFSLCYVTWLFSSTFWLFLLGFIFRTLGETFNSGTLQAYVFDFLKINRKEREFEKIWGRGNALRLVGIAIALSLGGVLSVYSYKLVLIFSVLTPLIVSGVALLLPQIKPITSTKERDYFSFLKGGIKRAFSHPILLRAFLYSGIIVAAYCVLEEYNQVLLSSWLTLPNSFIGIWLAIGVAISSIGAFYAYKLRHINWQVLNIVAIITGIILIVIAFFQSLFLLGILLLLSIFGGLVNVLIQGIIQKEIDSCERATIASINAFVLEVGAISLGLAFGFIANQFGIQVSYGFFGLFILVYLLGHFIIKKVRQITNSA